MAHASAKRVASRWLQGARAIYFHGTAGKNARRILKEGLLPAGTKGLKLVYDDPLGGGSDGGISKRTYGGVYLSRSLDTASLYAMDATVGDESRLVVMVTLESRSPGVLLDEDALHSLLQDVVPLRYDFDLVNGTSPWADELKPFLVSEFSGDGFKLEHMREAARIIETTDLRWRPKALVEKLLKVFPRAQRDFQRRGADVLAAADELFRATGIHLLESSFEKNFKGARKPSEIKGSYNRLRKAVDGLLKLLPSTTTESRYVNGNNVRIHSPITYRGKNRILSVVEMIHDYDNERDLEYMTFKVHYGVGPHKQIVDPIKRDYIPNDRFAGGYRVVDRSGRVLEEDVREEAA